MSLLILAAYGAIGAYIGIKATEKMYPVNRPDRMDSGCIILASMAMWPMFILIWVLGLLFDKTTNY